MVPRKKKCSWGSDCPFCKAEEKKGEESTKQTPTSTKSPEFEQDQIPITMGGGDGKTKQEGRVR